MKRGWKGCCSLVLTTLALVVAACSSIQTPTADGGETSSGQCLAADIPPTDSGTLRVYQLAADREHAKLDRVFGQFACGASPLYRGTFAADDNSETISGGSRDVLASGPVIASLEPMGMSQVFLSCETIATGGRSLVVMGTNQPRAIRLFQPTDQPGVTYSTLVDDPSWQWSGTAGSCAGCVTDLRSGSPATIDIMPARFEGRYCSPSIPLTVVTEGHLAIVRSPSFEDILAINQQFGDRSAPPAFHQDGADMVLTMDDVTRESISPLPGYDECTLVTPYHVDWYVRRQDLTVFGLRNFRTDDARTDCIVRI